MVKFKSINNAPQDDGEILICKDSLYVTKYQGSTRLLCSNSTGIYAYDITLKADNNENRIPSFTLPNASQYATNIDLYQLQRKLFYFTNPIKIDRLLGENAFIVKTSTSAPLCLYYNYKDNNLFLRLYNFDTREDSVIKKIANISQTFQEVDSQIKNSKILFGNFFGNKQNDIFISSTIFGYDKKFLSSALEYSEGNLLLDISCVDSDLIKIGDFNGDKFSDILCIRSKLILINKQSYFTSLQIIDNLPGNWNLHFNNQNSLYLGDFDGNGLTDLLSYSEIIRPQIIFRNVNNTFTSYNSNPSGAFDINYVQNWCRGNDVTFSPISGRLFLIADVNNDGKEDILCQTQNSNYLMISQNNPLSQTIHKITISMDEFTFNNNLKYIVKNYTVPLICNASNVLTYNTKLSCDFNSKNTISYFTLPFLPSTNLARLQIGASIYGFFDINPIENDATQFIQDESAINQELQLRVRDYFVSDTGFIKFNTYSSVRDINTSYEIEYYRGKIAKNIKENLASQKYTHIVNAGTCNEVNFDYVELVNSYHATGKMCVYDSNNNSLKGDALLNNIFNQYSISSSKVGFSNGCLVFVTNGEIGLKTLLHKNVTRCSINKIDFTQLSNRAKKPSLVYPTSVFSSFINGYENSYTKGVSVISRNDVIAMNGYIYNGQKFFPESMVNQNTRAYDNGISYDDLHSTILYNNVTNLNKVEIIANSEMQLMAYVNQTHNCPRNELVVRFYRNKELVYQPAIPYAAFDSIRTIKLEPFDHQSILMTWSIYLYSKQQFFILLDYIKQNVSNDLLRISSYDGKFSVLSFKQYNSFLIAYRKEQYTLSIANFSITTTGLLENKIIDIDVYPNHQSEFEIKKYQNDSISLIRSHNNIRGIFIQKYDYDLNQSGPEQNIICFPQNVKTYIKGNHTIVAWQGLTNDFNKTHVFLQYIVDDTFIERKNIFNGQLGMELKGVQFAPSRNHIPSNFINSQYFPDLPGNTTISYTVGSRHYLMKFNSQLVMIGLRYFFYDITQNKLLIFTPSALNSTTETGAFSQAAQPKNLLGRGFQAQEACECSCEEEEEQDAKNAKEAEVTQEEQTNEISDEANNFDDEIEANGEDTESLADAEGIVEETTEEVAEEIGEEAGEETVAEGGLEIPGVDVIVAAVMVATIAYQIEQVLTANDNLAIPSQRLNLNFNHDSKAYNANLDQKIDLEGVLNFLHDGLTKALPYISNIEELPKFKNFTDSIFCKNVITFDYVDETIVNLLSLLESPLAFEYHTSTVNTKCGNNNKFYPVYREGNIVHFCPSFDPVNYNQECKRLLKLAETLGDIILPIALPLIVPGLFALGPLAPILITVIMQVLEGKYLTNEAIDKECQKINPYHPSQQHITQLANLTLAGLISDKPEPIITPAQCLAMAQQDCTSIAGRLDNRICLTYFLETIATYSASQLARESNNTKYNCASGCDLDSYHLNDLLNYVGGYLNTNNISTKFFPRVDNVVTTELNTSFEQLVLSSTTHIYNKNSSLTASIYLENGYYEIRVQFLNKTTHPIGVELKIGRFRTVQRLDTAAFNESSVLIAYSVRQQLTDHYNILVEYLSQTFIKVLNVFSSYNGIFSLAVVPGTSDFIISFLGDNSDIITKKYTVTKDKIYEQFKVVENIFQPHYYTILHVATFKNNLFNIIWSHFNKTGIFIQKYDLITGYKIRDMLTVTTEQILSLVVDSNVNEREVIAWQDITSVHAQMFDITEIQNYPIVDIITNIAGTNSVLVNLQLKDEQNFEIILNNFNTTFFTKLYDASNGLLLRELMYIIHDNGTITVATNDNYLPQTQNDNKGLFQRRVLNVQSVGCVASEIGLGIGVLGEGIFISLAIFFYRRLSSLERDITPSESELEERECINASPNTASDEEGVRRRLPTNNDEAEENTSQNEEESKEQKQIKKYNAQQNKAIVGMLASLILFSGSALGFVKGACGGVPDPTCNKIPVPSIDKNATNIQALIRSNIINFNDLAQQWVEAAASATLFLQKLDSTGHDNNRKYVRDAWVLTISQMCKITVMPVSDRVICEHNIKYFKIINANIQVCSEFEFLKNIPNSTKDVLNNNNNATDSRIGLIAVSASTFSSKKAGVNIDGSKCVFPPTVVYSKPQLNPYCFGKYIELLAIHNAHPCSDLTLRFKYCGETYKQDNLIKGINKLQQTLELIKSLNFISNTTNPNLFFAFTHYICNIYSQEIWDKIKSDIKDMYNMITDAPNSFVINYYGPCTGESADADKRNHIDLCESTLDLNSIPRNIQLTNANANKVPYLYQSILTVMMHELTHDVFQTDDNYPASFYISNAKACSHTFTDPGYQALTFATAWEILIGAATVDFHAHLQ